MSVLVGTILPLLVLAVVAMGIALRPVTRHRLERFALRQRLGLTPRNVGVVVRYLTTTRRWRASGMAVAAVGFLDWSFVIGRPLHLDLAAVFVGWFAGAVAAEWRIAAPESAGTRTASLQPRRLSDYVTPVELALTALVWIVAVAAYPVGGVVQLTDGSGLSAHLVVLLAVAVVAGVVLVLVARRVLDRPQPLGDAEVVAADDALRSRSLHVLVGSALAIAGYFGAAAVTAVAQPDSVPVGLAGAIGVALLPLIGAVVALGPHRSTRRVGLVPTVA